MGRVCPRCGRAVPEGTRHACPLATAPARDRARERERRRRETWRSSYSSREYREARDAAIERSHGACEACGSVVYVRTSRGWRKIARDFGATHHVRPLSRGGSNDASNVVVLCARCHGIAHSAACEGEWDAAGLLDAIRGRL